MDFYAVNYDLSESLASIDRFAQKEGYPWPVAQPRRSLFSDLRITYQSAKIAFGSDGIIVYRDGFSGGDTNRWRQVFEELSR